MVRFSFGMEMDSSAPSDGDFGRNRSAVTNSIEMPFFEESQDNNHDETPAGIDPWLPLAINHMTAPMHQDPISHGDIYVLNDSQAKDPAPDETSQVDANSQSNPDASNSIYMQDDDLYLPAGAQNQTTSPATSICLDLDDVESSQADEAEELLKKDRLWQYRTAMRQLGDPYECLTGDTIDIMQNILKNETEKAKISTAHTLLMHPLWLQVGALPANFPKAASTAHRILAVMHHEDPKHWTVGEINLLESTFKHYDSMNSKIISIQVEEWVLPWLNGITGRDFTLCQMSGPRQSDGSSCGVHVLVALSQLLDGNISDHVADAAKCRTELLHMATEAFEAEFPGLYEEEPDSLGPGTTIGSPYDLGSPKISGDHEVILVQAPSAQSTAVEIHDTENEGEYGHCSVAVGTNRRELEIHELLLRQSYIVSPSHRRRSPYIQVRDTD